MMNNTKVHWPSFVRNNKFNDYYETWKVVWGGDNDYSSDDTLLWCVA